MGKLAGYPYPEIGPTEAAKIAETIKGKIGDKLEKNDREKLADILGHQSADSGAFRQKLTALKRYGLLEGRGTLHTTELADRLVEGDESVYRDMLEEVYLLNEAYKWFNGRNPGSTVFTTNSVWRKDKSQTKTWDVFLKEVIGTNAEVPSKLEGHYKEFVDLIPSGSHQEEPIEYLDKEREYEYYIKKLNNPNTRGPAVDALKTKLQSKKIPDSEPLDKVLNILRGEQYPEYQDQFYQLLKIICSTNDIDRFEEDKRDEVIDFLYNRLRRYSQGENITDRGNSRELILNTLEVLSPDDLVDELWDLLINRLQQGIRQSNEEMRKFANRELANRLLSGRDDIVFEFYENKADEAEDRLWEIMSSTNDEELQEDCESLLGKMGVL